MTRRETEDSSHRLKQARRRPNEVDSPYEDRRERIAIPLEGSSDN